MFDRKKEKQAPEERTSFDPRSRVSLYAMGGLYLGYLLYQLAASYLGGGASAPAVPVFLLGVLVLGGGMAALFYLAWRMFRTPVPVEEDEEKSLPDKKEAEEHCGEDAEI